MTNGWDLSLFELHTDIFTLQVLDLLWDLAHVPQLSTGLMEQALDEHLTILNDAYTVREEVKRKYVNKCVEDVKEVIQ